MVDIKKVADEAEVIIDGYAFSRFEGGYRVLNLNAPDKAAVFAADGSVLETTMNDFDEKNANCRKAVRFFCFRPNKVPPCYPGHKDSMEAFSE